MPALASCVVCGSRDARPVWSAETVPMFPFRPAHAAGGGRDFGSLAIVDCGACGHLYNAAFDESLLDDLYSGHALTNDPVSPGMVKAVEGIAAYILSHARPQPTVLEVGGGGGILSLLLAQQAREVHFVEPSRAVPAERFAGTRVTFHNAMFPAPSLGARTFDVVVCRQVIEHVPDPAPFLDALRAALADDGVAYVELPNADYVRGHRALVDFHYPHVHYFRRAGIETLFARAGFALADAIDIKNGHDMAFLMRAAAPWNPPPPTGGQDDGPAEALAAARLRGRRQLAAISGPIALYGANAYSQALLGLYPDVASFAGMFDDTASYVRQHAYGPALDIPIELPSAERLGRFAAVVITAYLHDVEIARKVRGLRFSGPVFTVRTDPSAGRGETPPSLFR